MLRRLGKGDAAGAAGERAVGIERDAVLRACRRYRHLAFGRGDPGLRQQPSGQHGFGQRHCDRKTSGGARARQNLRRGSRRSRRNPRPPMTAAGRLRVSACQSGAFQSPFLSRLMVWASARSAKIFSAVSATMFSLSATAFLVLHAGRIPFDLLPILRPFLRPMMGKSYPPDKPT